MTDLAFATLNHSPLVAPDVDLLTQIAAAAEAGYPMLSPDVFSIRANLAAGGSLAQIADAMSEQRLSCLDLAGLTIGADESRTKREADALLEIAEALRSVWVQVRVVDDVDDRIRNLVDWSVDRFAGASVGLAVEFSPLTKIRTIADARDLLAGATPGARMGVIVDTWHFFRGDDRWAALDAFPTEALAFVQFSDGLPPGPDPGQDTLHRRALPGDGVFDLEGFSERLGVNGYRGPVSVEVLSEALRTVPIREFARRTLETSLPFWRR
ncbi:MAG TPA: TIM barrel protein [Acidimicrobiia bacterium]|nr:TIM barrel protein [Acidimicrobiia bacterium]